MAGEVECEGMGGEVLGGCGMGGGGWRGVTKVDRFPHIHERPVIYFDFLIIYTCMHS